MKMETCINTPDPDELRSNIERVRLHFGIPIFDDFNRHYFDIPDDPHIFFVPYLKLKHRQGTLTRIKNVIVLLGHSREIDDSLIPWLCYGTDLPVAETIETYHKMAEALNWRPIDVALLCQYGERTVDPLKGIAKFNNKPWPFIFSSDGSDLAWKDEQICEAASNGKGGIGLKVAGDWCGVERWMENRRRNREFLAKLSVPSWAKCKSKDPT